MLTRLLTTTTIPWRLNSVQREARTKLYEAVTRGDLLLSKREACLCGSQDLTKIASIDRFGLDFSSYLCRDCGLVLTSPYISEASLARYYSEYYHSLTFGKNEPLERLFANAQGRKIFHKLKEYLPPGRIRVLEIGAGVGSNLLDFQDEASSSGLDVEALGIEYSQAYVEFGRKKGVELLQSGLREFGSATSDRFDVIIMSHVFEHFTDPARELATIRKISRENTLLYIEVPGILHLRRNLAYGSDLLKYLTHAHIFNFSLSTLVNVLRAGGFSLLSGNEVVETVFRVDRELVRNSLGKIQTNPANHKQILGYLADLEENLPTYRRRIFLERQWRRISRFFA